MEKLIKEELNKLKHPQRSGFKLINDILKEEYLVYEGLIKTYGVDETINHLKFLGLSEDRIKKFIDNDTPTISIRIKPNIEQYNKFNKEMELYGWFLNSGQNDKEKSYKTIDELIRNSNNNDIWLFYSAKFDYEVSWNDDRPLTLYHLTPLSRLEKIKSQGLTPKTKNKLANHPDRIYFFRDKKLIAGFINQFFHSESLEFKYKNKYILLEVYLPTEFPIRLFKDPDMDNAVYTLQNIKPENIKPIALFNLNTNGDIINVKNLI